MAFPDGLTLVTVSGHFDAADAGDAHGTIEFAARYPLVGPTDDTIVAPFTIAADLVAGDFTVQLPATNDPAWSPQDWAYAVRATVAGSGVRGSLQLDYQTTTVELADLIQVDGTAEAGASYILLARRSVAGGVAGLDTDGDVIDAAGDKVTGGAGGDVTLSGTVVSATSYGTSAAAGVATSVSRGDHTHGSHAAPASTDISDASTTGKAVLTAASAAAARTTLGAGTSSLAIGTGAGTAAEGNDSRLSDSRTPSAHASTHQPGGSDAMAVDQAAATASLRTLGTGSTAAAAGNHTHSGVYQPIDSDLTTIAGLTATTGNFMVAQSSAWASVAASTAKTALSLAKGDVGLGNVDNTADTAKTFTQSQVTGLTAALTARTPVLVLGPSDPVPGGTATGTVIVRTAT